MRATVMHGAGDVRVENVPDATLIESTDALLPSLLTLSDVMGTGHDAAHAAKVAPGKVVEWMGKVSDEQYLAPATTA
ncbi:MAG: hypothetical protein ABR563_12105 [Pyrinomonadaceae bacterium]